MIGVSGTSTLALKNLDEITLDVMMLYQGIGIGSIILNHLFYWTKEKYLTLKIPKLDLSSVDEYDENNKNRRNRLYEKIGLIERNALHISYLTPSN